METGGRIATTWIDGLEPVPSGPGRSGPWVPQSLTDVLFDCPEAEGETYFLLDAAAVPYLSDLLQSTTDCFQSLFQDEAAEELGDAAPWLARVQPDGALMRYAFTEGEAASWHLWSKPAGVFLRGHGGLGAIRSVLRRLTRVRTEDGAWFFLRLADPATLARYLDGPAAHGTCRAQVFADGIVRRVICRSRATAQVFAWDGPPPARTPVILLNEERLDFRLMIYERQAVEIEARLRRSFPNALDGRSPSEVCETVAAALVRLAGYGFDRPGDMEVLAGWDVLLGAPFESLDPSGEIARICTSDASGRERLSAIIERMDKLEAAGKGPTK
ncbi:hypothetical protein jaqu_24530 [Jannaschia aquimarina]|uniref:DUF4123 domain-containing protein n=1 Tax=Jannaschia aquimarina TaxID=935700 RepID=A0A0D1D7E0_9RHOB|nr:DUF4123 domain-containing protein [Jannaschia aquimarina]KIT15873.1 hypothetical protein jaqu_24530 [Jannaschia aquimarina]SNT10505.1 protein of unknown function [Jannaschia aquimarina]